MKNIKTIKNEIVGFRYFIIMLRCAQSYLPAS
jgi:hypothetical protein